MLKKTRRHSNLVVCALLMAVLLAGQACRPDGSQTATPNSTQVLQTVAVLQAQAVLPAVSITPEAVSSLPSNTPSPSATASLASSSDVPCLKLEYLGGVTEPAGGAFYPFQYFTRTWQVKNTGSCIWTTDYALVFAGGESMEGPLRRYLSVEVPPGDTVDLVVTLSAPGTPGTHSGYWMLQSSSGVNFGFGEDNSLAWSVEIEVIENQFHSDPIPEPLDSVNFDFAAAVCEAEWTSSFDPPSVPCPGYAGDQTAWAAILTDPLLEGGNQDNERTIWFHPDGQRGHWLTGKFPAYQVQPGDHFTAVIGCLGMSPMCDVSMSLEYIESDNTFLIGSWQEVNDGSIQSIDIDLSDLLGHTVQFALTVSGNSNASDPDAFWLVPVIRSLP